MSSPSQGTKDTWVMDKPLRFGCKSRNRGSCFSHLSYPFLRIKGKGRKNTHDRDQTARNICCMKLHEHHHYMETREPLALTSKDRQFFTFRCDLRVGISLLVPSEEECCVSLGSCKAESERGSPKRTKEDSMSLSVVKSSASFFSITTKANSSFSFSAKFEKK